MTHKEALCRVKGYLTDIIPIKDYSEVEEIIKALEQTTWIPCSERLPEEREDVLVTCFVHENWQTKIGYWNGKAWVVNAYDILFIDRLEVIAWQPLPEPYKGE